MDYLANLILRQVENVFQEKSDQIKKLQTPEFLALFFFAVYYTSPLEYAPNALQSMNPSAPV
jgi:hypothetical protein